MVGEDDSEVGCDIAREAIEVKPLFILNCVCILYLWGCIWYLGRCIWYDRLGIWYWYLGGVQFGNGSGCDIAREAIKVEPLFISYLYLYCVFGG